MNKTAFSLSLLLATSLLAISPLSAQTVDPTADQTAEKPSEAQRPHFSPVMPVKIKPRQGGADSISKAAADIEQENALNPDTLGLYSSPATGSLGGTLWQNFSAPDVAKAISDLPVTINSETMRNLLLRALLTTPDASPENSSGEAFSARLEKIAELGRYDQAFQLYKKLEGNIPTAKAALAGTASAFATNRTGLACLEEKALDSKFKQSEATSFWADLSSFCSLLLKLDQEDSNTTDSFATASKNYAIAKNLKATLKSEELNGKSVIEIMALRQAGLLPDTIFTPSSAKSLKPGVLALLISNPPSTAEARLSLFVAAVEKGLKTKEELANEYQLLAKTPVTGSGYWKSILDSYGNLQTSTDKAALLRSVINLTKEPDYTALQPFAAAFGSLSEVGSFTKEESKKVLSFLIRSRTSVSGKWLDKALESPDLATKDSVTDIEVIQALETELKKANSDQDDKKEREVIEIAQLHALSLILNENEAEDKGKDKSYENLLSLTGSTDYVMPSKEFMNNLAQASARQDTGKVILYSLQALNGQRVSQLHPAALYRITEALKSVGLVEEVRSLVHEALADMIE